MYLDTYYKPINSTLWNLCNGRDVDREYLDMALKFIHIINEKGNSNPEYTYVYRNFKYLGKNNAHKNAWEEKYFSLPTRVN